MTSADSGPRQEAVLHLLRTGLLDIRGSAHTGRKLSTGGVTGPGDVNAHISMIADVLKDLVLAVPSETAATGSLNRVWQSRSEPQRLWIAATLARHGVTWQEVIDAPLGG